MTAADNALTFQTVVKAVALRNGLCADFSPKPLRDQPGNGFHINISVKSDREFNYMDAVIAGILDKISEMTLFLNPLENSYERFGQIKRRSTSLGQKRTVPSSSVFPRRWANISA